MHKETKPSLIRIPNTYHMYGYIFPVSTEARKEKENTISRPPFVLIQKHYPFHILNFK